MTGRRFVGGFAVSVSWRRTFANRRAGRNALEMSRALPRSANAPTRVPRGLASGPRLIVRGTEAARRVVVTRGCPRERSEPFCHCFTLGDRVLLVWGETAITAWAIEWIRQRGPRCPRSDGSCTGGYAHEHGIV
jgi:hypothetical protein